MRESKRERMRERVNEWMRERVNEWERDRETYRNFIESQRRLARAKIA